MPIIYMVRHGRIASDSADATDPGLGSQGRSQAQSVARELSVRLPQKLPIVISPLRRCRETAAPLSALWGTEPVVEPRIAEVPGPEPGVLARDEWLRRALSCNWPQLLQLGKMLEAGYDTVLGNWRNGVLDAVLSCPFDAVMFSHFVPINVLTGQALRTERVAVFHPDNTSITIFETHGGEIRLLERGREMSTRVS